MDLGVRSWGNDPNGRRCSSSAPTSTERAQPKTGRGAASRRHPVGRAMGLALARSARGRDHQGRTGSAGRPRSAARPHLIAVLRAWFSLQEADAPAWYLGFADPIVGRTLRMMQNNPAHPWTVAGLASEVGVSPRGTRRAVHRGRRRTADDAAHVVAHRARSRPAARAPTRHRHGRKSVWATAARSLSALRSSACAASARSSTDRPTVPRARTEYASAREPITHAFVCAHTCPSRVDPRREDPP